MAFAVSIFPKVLAVTTEIKSFLLNLLVSAAPPKVDHFCNAGNKSEFRLKVLLSSLAIWVIKSQRGIKNYYHVTQQCCPGGNRPGTPQRPSAGGLQIFGAKSLGIPAIYTKFKLRFFSHKLEFRI